MNRFVDLFERLDRTTRTGEKLEAMRDYFRAAAAEDAAWAVYFLTGRRLRRLVGTRLLRQWTAELADLPLWLVERSYEHVGDLAETMALLLPSPEVDPQRLLPLHRLVEDVIRPLAGSTESERREVVTRQWRQLGGTARFLFNKLITGSLRVGVSKRLVTRALAEVAEVEPGTMAHRLMGDWQPTADAYRALLLAEGEGQQDHATPYPFFLASPLEDGPPSLGDIGGWRAEWKWDGIRAQLIRRGGMSAVWSRGEERLDGRFPEIELVAERLPDGTVLDGEILAWSEDSDPERGGGPLPFGRLQTRIGRRKPGPKTLARAPVRLLAFDLLERHGVDLRSRPLAERLAELERLLAGIGGGIVCAPAVAADSWDALAELRGSSRARRVEGLMLKRVDSPYRVGRTRGDWWKWKVEPYTFDAVLLYAQPGHGRRSGLFTDYTFGVHAGDSLVTVAKAYSGLTQAEIEALDRWIRSNTLERFGPVRSVPPEQVFELAFEGINRSPRHKSGIALRFPRIHRWRQDLTPDDADRLEDLERLIGE